MVGVGGEPLTANDRRYFEHTCRIVPTPASDLPMVAMFVLHACVLLPWYCTYVPWHEGVGDVVAGYVLGALSDSCASKPSAGLCRKMIVTFGTACYAVALGLTFLMKQQVGAYSNTLPVASQHKDTVSCCCRSDQRMYSFIHSFYLAS